MKHGATLVAIASLVAGLALPVDVLAGAQPAAKVPRIGALTASPAPAGPNPYLEALRQGLSDLGWTDVQFEVRYAAGQVDRLPALAAELAALPVDVLVVGGSSVTRAAKQGAPGIPIVIAVAADPVGTGLITPGGNVTGQDMMAHDIGAKQFAALRAVAPGVDRLGVLSNPTNPTTPLFLAQVTSAADSMGIRASVVEARGPGELSAAVGSMRDAQAQALLVIGDPVFFGQRRQLAELALENRWPSMFLEKDYADAGGLMAYGPSILEMYRTAARYVDRILKGTRSSELPVEHVKDLHLFVNGKTAKALGLTIPPSLLEQGARVLE